MARLTRKLNQKLVHWSGPKNDGMGGYRFTAPTEHSCRWQDRQETFIDFEGNERVSMAIIYLEAAVARKGSYVYLGRLTDLDSNDDDPKQVDGAFPIKGIGSSPNLRNQDALYKVYL